MSEAKSDSLERLVRALRRIEKQWPPDLMLFSWNGQLALWRGHPEDGGEQITRFPGIPSDGGDPVRPNDVLSVSGERKETNAKH